MLQSIRFSDCTICWMPAKWRYATPTDFFIGRTVSWWPLADNRSVCSLIRLIVLNHHCLIAKLFEDQLFSFAAKSPWQLCSCKRLRSNHRIFNAAVLFSDLSFAAQVRRSSQAAWPTIEPYRENIFDGKFCRKLLIIFSLTGIRLSSILPKTFWNPLDHFGGGDTELLW